MDSLVLFPLSWLRIQGRVVRVTDEEITDKELLEIVHQRRKQIKDYEQQERKPGTPIDSQPTVTRSTKAGNRHTKKGKGRESNLWEAPGKEYIKTANRFFEAIYRQYLRPNETKVLFFLLRKTWGWKKKSEFIPLSQFSQGLDMSKVIACQVLSRLKDRGIVNQLANKRYAIQSDLTLWKDKPKKKRARKESLTKK